MIEGVNEGQLAPLMSKIPLEAALTEAMPGGPCFRNPLILEVPLVAVSDILVIPKRPRAGAGVRPIQVGPSTAFHLSRAGSVVNRRRVN